MKPATKVVKLMDDMFLESRVMEGEGLWKEK
jgi:hypothetical protein